MDERSIEGWMVLCGLANQAHTHPSLTNGNMICNLAPPPPNDEERYLAWVLTARGRTRVSQTSVAILDKAVQQCQITLTSISTGRLDGYRIIVRNFFGRGMPLSSDLASSDFFSVFIEISVLA